MKVSIILPMALFGFFWLSLKSPTPVNATRPCDLKHTTANVLQSQEHLTDPQTMMIDYITQALNVGRIDQAKFDHLHARILNNQTKLENIKNEIFSLKQITRNSSPEDSVSLEARSRTTTYRLYVQTTNGKKIFIQDLAEEDIANVTSDYLKNYPPGTQLIREHNTSGDKTLIAMKTNDELQGHLAGARYAAKQRGKHNLPDNGKKLTGWIISYPNGIETKISKESLEGLSHARNFGKFPRGTRLIFRDPKTEQVTIHETFRKK